MELTIDGEKVIFDNTITAIGDILYGSAVSRVEALSIGALGDILTVAGGIPSWNHILQMQTNGLTIGLAASAPEPDLNAVHIWDGTAGVVTAGDNSKLIIESNGNAAISILIPNSGTHAGLVIGEGTTAKQAGLLYNYLASNQWSIYVTGSSRIQLGASTMAFQQAETISTSAGDIALSPAADLTLSPGSQVILDPVAQVQAILFQDGATIFYSLDTRTTTTIAAHTWSGADKTVASATFTNVLHSSWTGRTITLTGSTTPNSTLQVAYGFGEETFVSATDPITINKATTIRVTAPIESTNISLLTSSAIRILNTSGTPTNQVGIFIESLTAGVSANYALYMEGTPTIASVSTLTISTTAGDLDLNPTGNVVMSKTVALSGTGQLHRGSTSGFARLSGGSAADLGANVILYGESHATLPNKGALRYTEIEQIQWNATGIGFFTTAPVAKPTGVAVSAAGIHAALVTLGLIAA